MSTAAARLPASPRPLLPGCRPMNASMIRGNWNLGRARGKTNLHGDHRVPELTLAAASVDHPALLGLHHVPAGLLRRTAGRVHLLAAPLRAERARLARDEDRRLVA